MSRIATTVIALTTCGIVTTIIAIIFTNSNIIIIFRELVKRKTEIVMSLSVIDPRTQPRHHHSNEGIDRWDYFHHQTLSKRTFLPFSDFCYLFKFTFFSSFFGNSCNDNEKIVHSPSSDDDNSPTGMNNCRRLADKPPLVSYLWLAGWMTELDSCPFLLGFHFKWRLDFY